LGGRPWGRLWEGGENGAIIDDRIYLVGKVFLHEQKYARRAKLVRVK